MQPPQLLRSQSQPEYEPRPRSLGRHILGADRISTRALPRGPESPLSSRPRHRPRPREDPRKLQPTYRFSRKKEKRKKNAFMLFDYCPLHFCIRVYSATRQLDGGGRGRWCVQFFFFFEFFFLGERAGQGRGGQRRRGRSEGILSFVCVAMGL